MGRRAFEHILSGALNEYVKDQLKAPPEDQNSIQEELALTRAAAATSIEAFSKAVESGNKENIFITSQMVKEEIKGIAAIARTSASIQASNSDQMTKAAVEGIISGIVDIIFNVLRVETNGLEIATRIEREIMSKVNLSIDKGTISLPSDDVVRLMDSSVPDLPPGMQSAVEVE